MSAGDPKDRIASVVVVGGGIAGWSAAAALKRRLPYLSVTIVPMPPPPDALADRIASTLPSVIGFHEDLGLSDADAVVRTGSGYRLGTRFEGWTAGGGYIHAYGRHGRPLGPTSFHLHWVRAALAGTAEPFDAHCAAAVLGREGRFAPPADDPASPLADHEFGLRLDLPAYLAMLRAFARHCGVVERPGEVAGVRLRPADGFVDAVALADGTQLSADLFLDCSGPRALLRSALDGDWEAWDAWLPCDRLLLADGPARPDPPTLDRAVAEPAGWRWVAPGPQATSYGFCYAAAHLSDDAAAERLRGEGAEPAAPPVAIRTGTRPEPWTRNCVALGDAAVAVEPLEWTGLHLVHSAIDRVIAMMPDRHCRAVELADYNRQAAAEAMRVRDFLALHYAVSDRPEPFWRAATIAPLPPSLAYTLALFRERGRLPFFEEETFAKDSWLAVLIGQGAIPRRTDPLIDAIPPDASARAMAAFRDALGVAIRGCPTHADYLAQTRKRIAR